jgi:hypothetical protein
MLNIKNLQMPVRPGQEAKSPTSDKERTKSQAASAGASSPAGGRSDKELAQTVQDVGMFVVHALPALIEIARKGGRYTEDSISHLRASFHVTYIDFQFRCISYYFILLTIRLQLIQEEYIGIEPKNLNSLPNMSKRKREDLCSLISRYDLSHPKLPMTSLKRILDLDCR